MQRSGTGQSTAAAPISRYGYAVVTICFFILLIGFAIHYSFGVFFTPVIDELGWSRAALSGAFSISWILQGVLAIFMGWLNDRLGPRIVLSVSGFLVGAGYLLLSQINTVWELYLYYGVVIGIGLSGLVVPLLSTVARHFTVKRSMMTSIAASGVGVGILVGPPLINMLVSANGWRQSYLILGGLVMVVIIVLSQWLRKPRTEETASTNNEEVLPERKARAYNFSLKEAARTGTFWIVFAIFFCLAFCEYIVMVHIVPHAIDMGVSAAASANILSFLGGASVVGCIVLSGAADKIGVRLVYLIGFLLLAACLFWFIVIDNVIQLYVCAAIFGFGLGGMSAAQSLVVASLFGFKAHGVIFGILNNGLTIGATITPILAGYIFDVTGAYYPAFIASGAVGCVGVILTLWMKRPSPELLIPVKQ